MTKASDRELFLRFLSALSALTTVTAELLEKQLIPIRELAKINDKFTEAANKPEFWDAVGEGLTGSDVGRFFVVLSRLGELGGSLTKLNTMIEPEQDKVIREYIELTKALRDLSKKVSK